MRQWGMRRICWISISILFIVSTCSFIPCIVHGNSRFWVLGIRIQNSILLHSIHYSVRFYFWYTSQMKYNFVCTTCFTFPSMKGRRRWEEVRKWNEKINLSNNWNDILRMIVFQYMMPSWWCCRCRCRLMNNFISSTVQICEPIVNGRQKTKNGFFFSFFRFLCAVRWEWDWECDCEFCEWSLRLCLSFSLYAKQINIWHKTISL